MKDLTKYTTDLSNWVPSCEIHTQFPQFKPSQLKHLFWKREEHVGLAKCCKLVGKRLYVCVPVFGLWLAGEFTTDK